MKFLAVLKDSLREAIDTKVFYVMVGLSLLVTLFSFTTTFTPKPAAEDFMKGATLALNAGAVGDVGEVKDFRDLLRRLEANRQANLFAFVSGGPADGSPDDPSGTFRAVVRALPLSREAANRLKESSGGTEEFILANFGKIDDLRMVQATEVRRIDRPKGANKGAAGEAFFEVTAQPTVVTRRLWPHVFSFFFGAVEPFSAGIPLGLQLFIIENYLVGFIGATVTILISIIITAFFIPNMLRKGTIDLLVVKPIHRTTLLIYKYVGGLTFIFLNTAVAVGGVWLALSIRSGVWAPGFLWMIPILTFSFAILYAVSALFGVLTRSAIVAILITICAWFGLWIVSVAYDFVEADKKMAERANKEAERAEAEEKKAGKKKPAPGDEPVEDHDGPRRSRKPMSPAWFANSVRAIHFVLPRRGDLSTLTSRLLLRDLLTANQIKAQKIEDTSVSWPESLSVSLVFIAIFLGLACWRFATKDY
jgi:ABC-type transport system involved in multi-copper enzyme maturation permease subunit